MLRGLFAVVVVCIAGSSCIHAGVSKGLGESCNADTECSSPFTCRAPLLSGLCTVNKECTMQCSTDQECQSHDTRARCEQGCNEKICRL